MITLENEKGETVSFPVWGPAQSQMGKVPPGDRVELNCEINPKDEVGRIRPTAEHEVVWIRPAKKPS